VATQPHQPGYIAEQRYATTTIHETWTLAGEPVEMTVVRPTGNGVLPLIIYLPGLGEPSSGGLAWRNAWAQAGYAVLSLQSATNGETILTSAHARRAEFLDLAREQFSRAGLARRLAILRDAFEELNRRQGRGALAGVDLSHIALAGLDLGAQTVMAAAGESGYGIEPFALPPAVQCVIVLSPYADFAGASFDRRFATVHVSVLSVTSVNDTDSYGLVAAPAIRRAPFEHMPPDCRSRHPPSGKPSGSRISRRSNRASGHSRTPGMDPSTRQRPIIVCSDACPLQHMHTNQSATPPEEFCQTNVPIRNTPDHGDHHAI
jgi:hypothetical protein